MPHEAQAQHENNVSVIDIHVPPAYTDGQRELLRSLGTVLTDSGFNQVDLNQLLGLNPGEYPRRRNSVLQRHRIDTGEPIGVLAEVFILGGAVDVSSVQTALPGIDLDGLMAIGVLDINDGHVSSPLSIVPFAGMLIACDLFESGTFAHEFVPAVTASSLTVMAAIPRENVTTSLDIGTGSGLQALVMADSSQSVLATDINERALNFLRIGAALNGLDNIEVALGSMLEPVENQQFDLIVSNPPFGISPDVSSMYLHGGMRGDELSRQLIADVGKHLCEGGTAVLLCNWAYDGNDWTSPLAELTADSGCDLVSYVMSWNDAVGYVEQWHSMGYDPVGERSEDADSVEHWLRYLQELDITNTATGLIYLRRRTEGIPNWSHFGLTTAKPGEHFGNNVMQIFESVGFLKSIQDEHEIFDYTFKAVDMQQVEVRFRAADGESFSATGVTWSGGIGISVTCSAEQLELIEHCDGNTPLREIVEENGSRDDTLAFVKEMLVVGLLKPVKP